MNRLVLNNKEYKFNEISFNITDRVDPNNTDLNIYVGLEHLDPDCIHINRKGKPSDVKGTKFRIYPGDMIFGKRRAYQRKAALADFDGICSAHAMVLRPNSEVILPELFPFFIHSDVFMNRAIDISEGSLSPTIKWKILANEEFKLPPLDEQKRIADLLWSVDKSINHYRELLNEISLTRMSILKELFKNNHHEVTNIKLSDLPIKEINGMWKTNKEHNAMYAYIIRSTEIQPYGEISYDTAQKHKVNKSQFIDRKLLSGDIIIERSGGGPDQPVGRVCLFDEDFDDYTFSNFTSVIRIENYEIILPKYLFNYLLFFYKMRGTDRLQKQTTGIRNLDYELYKNIKIPICDVDIQRKCVEKIKSVNLVRKDIEKHILNTQRIQKQIINKIFG